MIPKPAPEQVAKLYAADPLIKKHLASIELARQKEARRQAGIRKTLEGEYAMMRDLTRQLRAIRAKHHAYEKRVRGHQKLLRTRHTEERRMNRLIRLRKRKLYQMLADQILRRERASFYQSIRLEGL